jgi:hypothetical protein
MDSKYNKFIACWLANSIDTLFNDEDMLLYPVPFGNYQVGNYIDSDEFDNFKKDYEQYITDHSMKIILHDLGIANGIIHIYDCVFTLDGKYYKVLLKTEEGSIYSEDLEPNEPSWLYNNIENYEVYPKTITQTIYVSKNDRI